LRFEDLGERSVKNIARPVRAFRVRAGAAVRRGGPGVERLRIRRAMTVSLAAVGTAAVLIAAHWPQFPNVLANSASGLSRVSASAPVLQRAAAPRLSIVVLPFANLGEDPQQDYLVDGITDSLTTDLSHALPGSFVVARATAFTYKGKPVDPVRVGRDLN